MKQPWAELILQKRKKIELRKWNTKVRGRFLIHTSKIPDETSMENFGFKKLLCGFIVGKATLVNVKRYKNDEEFIKDKHLHLATKDWGVYGFILDNIKRIRPVPSKGQLGFWEFNYKDSN